ncbi:hypothetical protein E2R60_04955 [Paenibacillus dendritiformis]|uniref:hypothetical protein n=1 Tax=Paenibacillus dendritiformis TaxID=130049 RepID=UPI00105A268F|nr:hypothetical protein [Paenibacillus dendritiformis]TDL57832.1 hypothetical protein E2R60_04955 [Paenibacillus dendritiformis]
MKTIASIEESIREYVDALPVAEAINGILSSINDTIGTNWRVIQHDVRITMSISAVNNDSLRVLSLVGDNERLACYIAFHLQEHKDGKVELALYNDESEFVELGLPSGETIIPRGHATINLHDNSVEFKEVHVFVDEEDAWKRDRVIRAVKFPFNKWFYECAQRTHLIMPETHGMKPSFEAISALLEGGDRAPFEKWRRENEESCKRSYTSFSVSVDSDRVTINQGCDNEMTVYRTPSGTLEMVVTHKLALWESVALLTETYFSNQQHDVYYRCEVGDWRLVDESFIDEYLVEAINSEIWRIEDRHAEYDDSIVAWKASDAILLGTYDKERVYGFMGKDDLFKLRELPEGASVLDELD